ncbi:MAG: hypothetical protein K0S08_243 [Gammaproteobacteria bacterium]|jgi:prepilin-type N-terminal cleavage/methylation domain-containing protein|nr:hypothetical protein [Gammaproteobacteria bacterium]
MMTQRKKGLKGFSLLELLLAIAIIGLIILMATRYFTTVKSGQQASSAIQQITGIRSVASSQIAQGLTPAYSTICPALPANSCNGTTALNFAWDSPTTGTSAFSYTAGNTNYVITINGIPSAVACQNILSGVNNELAKTGTPAPVANDCVATPTTLTLTFPAA